MGFKTKLVFAFLLTLLFSFTVSAARAEKLTAAAGPAAGCCYLVPAANQKVCLGVPNYNKEATSPVLHTLSGDELNMWYLEKSDGGTYCLVSYASGWRLEVKDSSVKAGAIIRQSSIKRNNGKTSAVYDNQRWYLMKHNGSYIIQSSLSKCVLGQKNNSVQSGSVSQLQTWGNKAGQKWFVIPCTARLSASALKTAVAKAASAVSSQTASVSSPTPVATPKPTPTPTPAAAKPSQATSSAAVRTVYLVGDSRTVMMHEAVGNVKNCVWYAKVGSGLWDNFMGTTLNTLKTKVVKHSAVVIMLGVNDFENTSPLKKYIQNVKAFVTACKGRDVKVYCVAITPVRKANEKIWMNKWNKEQEKQLIALNKTMGMSTSPYRAGYYNPISKAGKMTAADFKFVDSLHYTTATSKKLFTNIYNYTSKN